MRTLTVTKATLIKLFQPGIAFRRGEPVLKVDLPTDLALTNVKLEGGQLVLEFADEPLEIPETD